MLPYCMMYLTPNCCLMYAIDWQAEEKLVEAQSQLASSRAQESSLQEQLLQSQGQLAEQLRAAQAETEDLRQHASQLEATCAGLKVCSLDICSVVATLDSNWMCSHQEPSFGMCVAALIMTSIVWRLWTDIGHGAGVDH